MNSFTYFLSTTFITIALFAADNLTPSAPNSAAPTYPGAATTNSRAPAPSQNSDARSLNTRSQSNDLNTPITNSSAPRPTPTATGANDCAQMTDIRAKNDCETRARAGSTAPRTNF